MGARETRGICGRWKFINKAAGKKKVHMNPSQFVSTGDERMDSE